MLGALCIDLLDFDDVVSRKGKIVIWPWRNQKVNPLSNVIIEVHLSTVKVRNGDIMIF